jgi:hypothetical protein
VTSSTVLWLKFSFVCPTTKTAILQPVEEERRHFRMLSATRRSVGLCSLRSWSACGWEVPKAHLGRKAFPEPILQKPIKVKKERSVPVKIDPQMTEFLPIKISKASWVTLLALT